VNDSGHHVSSNRSSICSERLGSILNSFYSATGGFLQFKMLYLFFIERP
jgi:hypothetical protein